MGADPTGPRAPASDHDPCTGPLSRRGGRPGRALGIDLGARRIGVAVSDEGRRVASALAVLPRTSAHVVDHRALVDIVAETGATVVVVGLPLSLTGAVGPAAAAVQAEVREMRAVLPVPVECCDERFSTAIARRAMATGGRRPAARRAVVDKMAAAAILQTWLDRQRPRPAGTVWPATEAASTPREDPAAGWRPRRLG